MTIPGNLDPQKFYVTPISPQPIYVHSGPGDQFAIWSAASLGDMLEVLEDPGQAYAKLGQSFQFIQVRERQGNVGWVDGGKVERAYADPTIPGFQPVQPLTPVPPITPIPPFGPVQPIGPGAPIPQGPPIYVHTTLPNGQWIRSGPDMQQPMKGDITIPDRVELIGDLATSLGKLGRYPEWVQVKTPKGIIGWAAAWYLERYPIHFNWPDGHALVGLHGSTESWADRWNEQAFQIISQARIEAVKMIASNNLFQQPQMLANIIARLRGLGVRFIMARLLARFEHPRTPQEFVDEVIPDAQALYNLGVRHFEVHNEPNLHFVGSNPEGMFVAWQNGAQFGDFFMQAVTLLRQRMPEALFGFPGLSPAHEMPKQIYKAETFLAEAAAAVLSADFICMHTYWGPGGSDYLSAIAAVKATCQKYPDKLIIVSEFANSNPAVSKDVKGREYALFYTEARKLPSNLGALFSYALASAGGDTDRMWAGSQIAQFVGSRSLG